jgi:hypothetical protein
MIRSPFLGPSLLKLLVVASAAVAAAAAQARAPAGPALAALLGGGEALAEEDLQRLVEQLR